MRRASNIFVGLLAGLLILQGAYSLHWPIAHDEAPLFYEAFLIRAEGRVPYRDIFDFQMPGSYAAYYTLGRLGGFNDFLFALFAHIIPFLPYSTPRRVIKNRIDI